MKKILGALAVAALIPLNAYAQHATLMYAFDLDGEAADADQIVTTANGDLLDSKTFTITASPDACRLIDMTVTDGDSSISAGTLTVAGVGCLGEPKSCSFTFAGGGSGVKTFTCTDGEGAYYASVTSITTGALTGEGGAGVDYASIGYTSNSVNGWAMYGTATKGPYGETGVDPFGEVPIAKLITTAGVSTTTVDGVNASDNAFDMPAVGDLILITSSGQLYERKITAKASADSVTVNAAITIPAAGVTYRLKKAFYTTNPAHMMMIPVGNAKALLLNWSVDANANTGGVVTLFQCTDARGPEWPTGKWVQISTTTVSSGSTQVPTAETVNLETTPYSFCRFGVRFGTGDDGDGAAEDINASIMLTR